MNKLILAASAIVLACGVSLARAQSEGSAPGAQGQEMKKEDMTKESMPKEDMTKDDTATPAKKHKMKKHHMKKQSSMPSNSPSPDAAESAGNPPK